MKYTILGFQQIKLLELGLDLIDTMILRWFVDFNHTNKMAKEIINNEEYYWINYQSLLNDIPIIKIQNKRALSRRLSKLVDAKILKFHLKKSKGTYTFFNFDNNYSSLIYQEFNEETQKYNGMDSKVQPCMDSKVQPKDHSTKINNSIKDPLLDHLKKYTEDLYIKYYKKRLNIITTLDSNEKTLKTKFINKAIKHLKVNEEGNGSFQPYENFIKNYFNARIEMYNKWSGDSFLFIKFYYDFNKTLPLMINTKDPIQMTDGELNQLTNPTDLQFKEIQKRQREKLKR